MPPSKSQFKRLEGEEPEAAAAGVGCSSDEDDAAPAAKSITSGRCAGSPTSSIPTRRLATCLPRRSHGASCPPTPAPPASPPHAPLPSRSVPPTRAKVAPAAPASVAEPLVAEAYSAEELSEVPGCAVEEAWQFERYSKLNRSWGAGFPSHFLPKDPQAYTTRLLSGGCDSLPEWEGQLPSGWKWADASSWRIEKATHQYCDNLGWIYAMTPAMLQAMQELPEVADAKRVPPRAAHVRWRRHVRIRVRKNPRGAEERALSASRLTPGELPGGFAGGGVPEEAIACEGWLVRLAPNGHWRQNYTLLTSGGDEAGGPALVFCEGTPDNLAAAEQLREPPQSFETNGAPPLPRLLEGKLTPRQLATMFGLGSRFDGENSLPFIANSPVDAKRWRAAILSVRGELGALEGNSDDEPDEDGRLGRQMEKPGTLSIALLGASGLATVRRGGGLTDAYATLQIKGGGRTWYQKTQVVRRSVAPVWNAEFKFRRIFDPNTQLVVLVKHYDRFTTDYLGQVAFTLAGAEVPDTGEPTDMRLPLQTVTEMGRSTTRPPQGVLALRLAWFAGTEDDAAEALRKRVKESGELTKYMASFDAPSDEGSSGEDDDDDDDDDVDDPKSQAAQERARARAEEEQIARTPPTGDYQLQVHVHEARDLVGRDASGLSDPSVFVRCFEQTKRTATQYKQSSPVWDEQLFFTAKDMDEEALYRTTIEVTVYDIDTIKRDDIVGQYFFDAMNIYYAPNHQLWRQWVALSAPFEARDNLLSKDDRGGVQGYLKLSVTLLGPDDKPVVHADDEPDASVIMVPPTLKREVVFVRIGVHRALGLPIMDTALFGGRKKGGAIDAYLKLWFTGYKARTPAITSQNPQWMIEFWVPILVPSVGQKVRFVVRDKDIGRKDEDVAEFFVSFDRASKGLVPELGWYQLYGMSKEASGLVESGVFASRRTKDKRAELDRHQHAYVSEWRGKVLLSLSVEKVDDAHPLPEKLLKRPIRPNAAHERRLAPTRRYQLRCAVLMGSDLKHALKPLGVVSKAKAKVGAVARKLTGTQRQEAREFRGRQEQARQAEDDDDDDDDDGGQPDDPASGAAGSSSSGSGRGGGGGGARGVQREEELYVEVTLEEHIYRSGSPTMVGGHACFLKDAAAPAEQPPPGLLRKLNEAMPLEMSHDVTQLADVFLYLCDKEGSRVAFHRFEAHSLVPLGAAFAPRWVTLTPMVPRAERATKYESSLLVSMALFEEKDAFVPWPPPPQAMPHRHEVRPYELRCHVFQGRKLPALDDDGVCDAYVHARFGGKALRSTTKDKLGPEGRCQPHTKVQPNTLYPTWNETLVTQTWLPWSPSLHLSLAPQLSLAAWDGDGAGGGVSDSDDFIGATRLDLRGVGVHKDTLPYTPRWVALCDRYGAAGSCGELLLQLELIPLDEPYPVRDTGARPLAGAPALAASDRPTRTLVPRTTQATFNCFVLGVRGLRAASSLGGGVGRAILAPKSPFVSIDNGTIPPRRQGKAELTSAEKKKMGSTRTATSHKPSAASPTYMEQLKLQLQLPLNPTFLPTAHLRVKDSLFGGLRQPLIGVGTYDLTAMAEKLRAARATAPASEQPQSVTVETWENQRLVPGVGWGPRLPVPHDPPRFSTKEPPYRAQSKASFELPSHAWIWEGPWAPDLTLNARDADGWGYAHDWRAAELSGLQPEHHYDLVRRRRWVRTYVVNPDPGISDAASEAAAASMTSDGADDRGDASSDGASEATGEEGDEKEGEEGGGEEGEGEEEASDDEDDGRDPVERLVDKMNKAEDEVRKLKARVAMFKELANREEDLKEAKEACKAKRKKLVRYEADFERKGTKPSYMRDRDVVTEELENTLTGVPFETIQLWSGQGRQRVVTGRLKALVSLQERGVPQSPDDLKLLEAMAPQEFVVRVYILQGRDLISMDAGGYSDPYLKVSLGKKHFSTRDRHLVDVSNANFFEAFEFNTSLPGVSMLRIECVDHDDYTRDDLIGATEIDLEDRVCCPMWQMDMSARPPVEWRSLYSQLSRNPQGLLECWVDILPPEVAQANPMVEIKPPPPQEWELRVICWKAKDCVGDDYSGLSDLYCEFRFPGTKRTYQTDTHYRAKNGKASWNYRVKFAMTLDSFLKDKRLTVQLWDRDIGSNDCLGFATLTLDKWLKRIFRRRLESHQYWTPEHPLMSIQEEEESMGVQSRAFESLEELAGSITANEGEPLLGAGQTDEDLEDAKFWCEMINADGVIKGKVLLSIEAVPKQEFDNRKAGYGRSDPNENPTLPKPVGRLKFSLNPCVAIYSLLGPRLCRQLSCLLCIVLLILLAYYMVPVILGEGIYEVFADLFDSIF